MNIIKVLILVLIASNVFSEALDFNTYLAEIKATHPVFESYKNDSEALTFDSKAAYEITDWKLNANTKYIKEDPVQPGVFTPIETENLNTSVELTRKLLNSGTDFSFELNQNNQSRLDNQIGNIDVEFFPANFYQSGAFLKVKQDLFRNRDGTINKFAISQSKLFENSGSLNNTELAEKELLSFASDYIEWVRLYEQYLLIKNRLKLSQDQYDQMKRKRTSALITEADLFRAEQDLWTTKQSLYESEALYESKREELITNLNNKKFTKPTFNFFKLPKIEKEISSSKLKSLRVLKQLEISKSLETLNKDLAVENSKHDLSLELGAGLQSGGVNSGSAYDYNQPSLFAGVSYTRALDQTKERNTKTASELRELKQVKLYEKYKRDIEAGINSIRVLLKNLEKAILATKNQILAAGKRTIEERKLYEQGRGELNFVIQSSDSELSSKLQLVNLTGRYQQSYLSYRELIDDLY